MRLLTGVLSQYNITQLSLGVRPHETILKYEDRPFYLKEPFTEYKTFLERHWKQESPNLRNMGSIVSLQCAELTHNEKAILTIHCRPTDYFEFLLSNYSLDITLPNQKSLRTLVTDLGVHTHDESENRALYAFPRMGNSIGITISVITADNCIVISKRSETCASIAQDKGNFLCAVGTQIKRHQSRFLGDNGFPYPELSAREGLHDEMGEAISESCPTIECLGFVFRNDFQHTELLYETTSSMTWEQLRDAWREMKSSHKQEFQFIDSLRIDTPTPLIDHLERNPWSPQAAAGAYHSLLRRYPTADHCGMLV